MSKDNEFTNYPPSSLGPQLRRWEDVPSLNEVVLEHFFGPDYKNRLKKIKD